MMTPKNLPGAIPGKDFDNTGNPNGIKVGIITRVDEINLKADVRVITGGGDRFEIELTQGLAGPRSFWGGIPEVDSVVIIGYRRTHKQLNEAVILGYIPSGNRSGLRFDPFSASDPTTVSQDELESYLNTFGSVKRFKRLMLKPGDVGGMSSSGAEMVLSKDVKVVNRSGESLELRDSDRTLVTQAIHRVEVDSGVRRISGPIRRGAMYLPPDLFGESGLLKDVSDGYYGRDELQNIGPGADAKISDSTGKVLDLFNNTAEFPPVTYSNGKRVHYPPTTPGVSVDDLDGSADAFVEDRIEISHTSDLGAEVLDEIDGFAIDRREPYIERVLGTVVGNATYSTKGLRQYAKLLKPRLFPDFASRALGRFTLEEVNRQPTAPDIESVTSAGAFYFRIRPPRATNENAFVAAVSKQGKLFLNIPGSSNEDYPSGTKKISAELNLEGALKAYIGASNPDRVSVHATLEGGLVLDIGRDAKGNAITTRFHSGTKTVYEGNPNEDGYTHGIDVRGIKHSAISGAEQKSIEGSKQTVVSGLYQTQADRINLNAHSGASFNFGEWSALISGKTQLKHAQEVVEDIITGGKTSTILSGGLTQTVAVGGISYTALSGPVTTNAVAGNYSVTVGAGAISVSTGAGAVTMSTASGAMSLSAAAGAITLTAGLALNLSSGLATTITAPQILLGGVSAVLGVARGTPAMPVGMPTLDYITGLPLLGSAMVRSI